MTANLQEQAYESERILYMQTSQNLIFCGA